MYILTTIKKKEKKRIVQCHSGEKKRALRLRQAICYEILPPRAWHAAIPESNTVNHFKEESFPR